MEFFNSVRSDVVVLSAAGLDLYYPMFIDDKMLVVWYDVRKEAASLTACSLVASSASSYSCCLIYYCRSFSC